MKLSFLLRLSVWMTLAIVGQHYHAEFAADYRNVSISTVTECKGKVPFYTVNEFPITGSATTLDFHRPQTPHGERCTVIGFVNRNADPVSGKPDDDYVGESVTILQED